MTDFYTKHRYNESYVTNTLCYIHATWERNSQLWECKQREEHDDDPKKNTTTQTCVRCVIDMNSAMRQNTATRLIALKRLRCVWFSWIAIYNWIFERFLKKNKIYFALWRLLIKCNSKYISETICQTCWFSPLFICNVCLLTKFDFFIIFNNSHHKVNHILL